MTVLPIASANGVEKHILMLIYLIKTNQNSGAVIYLQNDNSFLSTSQLSQFRGQNRTLKETEKHRARLALTSLVFFGFLVWLGKPRVSTLSLDTSEYKSRNQISHFISITTGIHI